MIWYIIVIIKKHYTGFHYFNKWILEGAAKKYNLKEIRVNANEWNQMTDD